MTVNPLLLRRDSHQMYQRMRTMLPETIADVEQLDELLSEPTEQAIRTLRDIPGDVMLLGAGGKMGPTLARMIRRASEAAGLPRQVTAVSRFSQVEAVHTLEAAGIKVIRGDLLDEQFVETLPQAPNVIFMAGMKFGTSSDTSATWAMNTLVPASVARQFPNSRIAAFSTGNRSEEHTSELQSRENL